MTTIILNLILINIIVCLVFNAGFWDTMDSYVNKKYPLHHLPHLLTCALCQCWWLGFLYLLVTGNLTLLTIALALMNATLTSVMIPLLKLIENYLLKIIEIMNRPL